MPTSSRVLYYLQPSVGATLAVARGRGRAPPLRTTKKPTALLEKVSLRSQCAHWLWQSVLLDLCAGVLRIPTTSLRTGLGMTRKFFRLLSLRGRKAPVAIRTPVLLAPLPKGGWHGEAVTGGYISVPPPL